MKDLVIVIVFLLILLVLADGIRRKRNERKGIIKVSRSLKKSLKQPVEDEEEPSSEAPSYTSELPNGGARVVGKRDPSVRIPSIEKKPQAKSYLEKHHQPEPAAPATSVRAQREPQQTSLNLGQSVPMLMESVDDSNAPPANLDERIEPSFSASRAEDLDGEYNEHHEDDYESDERDERSYRRGFDDDETGDSLVEDESDYRDEDEETLNPEEDEGFEDDEYSHEDEYDEDEDSEGDYEDDELASSSSAAAQNKLSEKLPAEPEEVLIINVMAHKGEMFNGADLLDIILKCGMRYGSMDIFHRYSDTKGEGALLFSMANMVKPGTFDLDAMDEFETPGVSLFMTLPINADSMQSFDLMADTARAIAETLDGELKDEQRSVMTRQTLEHCRERIRNFERMRLFRRPPPR